MSVSSFESLRHSTFLGILVLPGTEADGSYVSYVSFLNKQISTREKRTNLSASVELELGIERSHCAELSGQVFGYLAESRYCSFCDVHKGKFARLG